MYRGLRSLQIKSLALISACVVVAGCLSSSGSLYSKRAPFYQDLVWVSHRFNVRVDGQNLVLSSDVGSYTHALEGSVVGADVGDLNQDGSPEVLMYLSSPDDGRYGSVIGYSSNRGRSMSLIYAPLATNDAKYNRGYYGHDEFAIVEGTLVQPNYLGARANDASSTIQTCRWRGGAQIGCLEGDRVLKRKKEQRK
jgi:hypothetical protein